MIDAHRTLAVTTVALVLVGGSSSDGRQPLVVWNASASIPIGLYAIRPSDDPSVGDLVAIRAPERLEHWLVGRGYVGPGAPLLKRIAALSGSQVCRDELVIRVDGVAVATARERDRSGRALPIWEGCRVLRHGEVFVLNPGEPGSLDGRYFGPLPADMIMGRATPIWTQER